MVVVQYKWESIGVKIEKKDGKKMLKKNRRRTTVGYFRFFYRWRSTAVWPHAGPRGYRPRNYSCRCAAARASRKPARYCNCPPGWQWRPGQVDRHRSPWTTRSSVAGRHWSPSTWCWPARQRSPSVPPGASWAAEALQFIIKFVFSVGYDNGNIGR